MLPGEGVGMGSVTRSKVGLTEPSDDFEAGLESCKANIVFWLRGDDAAFDADKAILCSDIGRKSINCPL